MLADARQSPSTGGSKLLLWLGTPAIAIFLITNIVNVGNLSFNLIFSRWMGPALFGDLTLLLTLKLALLGILGALQSAVSQKIANVDGLARQRLKDQLAWLNRALLLSAAILVVLVSATLGQFEVGKTLGLSGNGLLLVLLLSLPFAASLSLLRGLALGSLNVSKIVQSLLIEMLVRLLGSVLAWQAGFGLDGVICSVGLSILAGWAVLADMVTWRPRAVKPAQITVVIGAASAPFALLYLAQVLALDGDILLAKVKLPAADAGLLASLILFQRIQFFACFGLASVLLPSIVIAVRCGHGLRRSLMPVFGLFSATSAIVLMAAGFYPDLLISLLVGPEYLSASPSIFPAALAATCFTFSFLVSTFLAALDKRIGIWATLTIAIAQLTIMWAFTNDSPVSINTLLEIKLTCQAFLAGFLGLVAARHIILQRN